MSLLLQILGLFFGVFVRTYFPYLRKLKSSQIQKFDKKYLYNAIYAIILAFVSVILIIPQYNLKEILNVSIIDGIKIFCQSFTFGFTWNSLLNEGNKWQRKK